MILKFQIVFGIVFSSITIIKGIEVHHGLKAYAAPTIIKAAPIFAVKHYEHEEHHEEHEGPAEYEFSYSVHDPHTGDIKSQKETRKGHKVEGSYELIDSDGHRRIVHYTSDKHTGFNAIVHREPTDIKIPIPEHSKKVIATPVHLVHSAPVHFVHSAPVHIPIVHKLGGHSDGGSRHEVHGGGHGGYSGGHNGGHSAGYSVVHSEGHSGGHSGGHNGGYSGGHSGGHSAGHGGYSGGHGGHSEGHGNAESYVSFKGHSAAYHY